ncbi:MAG: hypothetical protein OCC49_15995 [Fibrobacterales bacterium]
MRVTLIGLLFISLTLFIGCGSGGVFGSESTTCGCDREAPSSSSEDSNSSSEY